MKTSWHPLIQGFTLTLGLGLALIGCGKAGEDADESVSEVSAASIAGVANSTETNGGFAAYIEKAGMGRMILEGLRDMFSPVPQAAWADAHCPLLKAATCVEDQATQTASITLEYNNCRRERGFLNGSEKFVFSSLAVCQARTSAAGFPTEGNLVRTFGGTIDSSPTTHTVGDRVVSLDSATAYGYEVKVSGGATVEFGQDARTVNINGIRKVLKRGSEVRWDHSISSEAGAPLLITGGGRDKKIAPNGIVSVQHNLAKFTAKSKIVEELKFSAGCCHPISGKIETVYSGSKTGSETLVFGGGNGSCGAGTLTASDGSSSGIKLKHCF